MFEVQNHPRAFCPDHAAQPSTLAELIPEAAASDIEVEPLHHQVQPEQRGFELPARIWGAMIACYALFLGAMLLALSSTGHVVFAIVVSAVYVAVFFAVGITLALQNPGGVMSVLDRSGILMTQTGPMSRGAVYGQILVVPVAVAFFGTISAVIILLSGAAG